MHLWAPFGKGEPTFLQKSHIPIGQLFSFPFPIPPMLTTVILKFPRCDSYVRVVALKAKVKGRRMQSFFCSQPSGCFSISIPRVILPGPSVNKAISLNVTPQTPCRTLSPPWALSAPSLPASVKHWCGTGVMGHLSICGRDLRASIGEEGSRGSWDQVCNSPITVLHVSCWSREV